MQIALGGIGIGSGICILAFAILAMFSIAPTIVPFVPAYVQLFVGVVLLVVGLFNFNVNNGRNKQENKLKSEKSK